MKIDNNIESAIFNNNPLKTNSKTLTNEEYQQELNKNNNIQIDKNKLFNIKYLLFLINLTNPEIPEKIEFIEYIGYGSESKVFKAKIKNTNKFIAIKIIINENENININEINISKILKNPNVIQFYGYSNIVNNKLGCFIMEYAKLGNLRDFQIKIIKRNVLSESLLCFFAYQILNGLKYCHISKIAHLDLKPQNIIIDEYLNAKLIDFSISIDYSKTKSKNIQLKCKGTWAYMAPEVLSSEIINIKDLNKVDLFSFGVILYNLAFGIYPFNINKEDSKDYYKTNEKIKKENLDIKENKFFSSYFVDFVKKLLEKDINKRINIIDAINHKWIQSAKILLEEKEKIFNTGIFLTYLITDHFKNLNDFLG